MMRKCWLGLSTVMILLMTVLPFSGVTEAQERKKLRPQASQDPDAVPVRQPRGLDKGPISVFVELTGQPTTVAYAARKRRGGTDSEANTEAKSVLVQNLQAQQRLTPFLRSLKTPELYRTQRVLNGIAVRANANQIASLSRLPGVRKVTPIVTKYVENATSVPLIGAPDVWRSSAGRYLGEGISIGVIDTGVDYLHTDFGGPGTGYDTNDTTIAEAGGGFPSAKVVGGYDFVGDDYNANDPATSIPTPDPDPMDCNGHGSHVSGTATGYGVTFNGQTFSGPYSQSTPFDALRIGPGVAPKADLYALRIFGCDGSTDVTDQAIEWSVDPNGDGDFSDHLDVINMSLGSDFGGNFDTTAAASNNASLAGVIVAASAGNSGDTYYIGGSPGSADRVISSASSADSTAITDGFKVNSPASIATTHPAFFSVAYDWANEPDVTGTLVYPASQPTGCQAFNTENAALISGKVVLLQWTDNECGSVTRGGNVARAGGIGFILYDNSEVFDLLITGSAVIPGVSTPLEVGQTLLAHIDENISVTFSDRFRGKGKLVTPELTDTLSDFSSRGPARDNNVKPDVSAPGQTIFSVAYGTGDEGVSFNGTSMASPHTAGAMALLKEIHPTWTVEELKALIMNTAGQDIRSGLETDSAIYGPSRQGSGRITLPAAATSNVIAYANDNSGRVSVSFGEVEVVNTVSLTKTVVVKNKGTIAENFDLFYAPVTTIPGVSFSIEGPSTVTIDPGSTVEVSVRLDADASQMKHTRDQTVADTQLGFPRDWLAEIQGYLRITPRGEPAGRTPLRLSLYATARPASNMRATQAAFDFTDGMTNTLGLTGKSVMTGTSYPTDTVSLVSALELQATSPNDPTTTGNVNGADLKYVGAASNYTAAGTITDTEIYIGIATYGEWSTPYAIDSEFDIYFDTNNDGTDDYVMFNSALTTSAGDAQDVFITQLIDLSTGASALEDFINGVPAVIDTNPYNNSVMVMPVYAADLGLTEANSRFSYTIYTYSSEYPNVVDYVTGMSYDPLAPGIDTSATTLEPQVPGVTYPDTNAGITVAYDKDAYDANGSQGILLLHHHNVNGNTSEVVSPELLKTTLPLVFR